MESISSNLSIHLLLLHLFNFLRRNEFWHILKVRVMLFIMVFYIVSPYWCFADSTMCQVVRAMIACRILWFLTPFYFIVTITCNLIKLFPFTFGWIYQHVLTWIFTTKATTAWIQFSLQNMNTNMCPHVEKINLLLTDKAFHHVCLRSLFRGLRYCWTCTLSLFRLLSLDVYCNIIVEYKLFIKCKTIFTINLTTSLSI